LADDRRADRRVERAWHLVAPDLDASQRIMMPHAADAEAERMKSLLRALDHAQLLIGHLRMIRNAGRQTGRCRLVPRRQPGAARELADFVLRQIDFIERTANAELARRLTAWPVIAAVVGIVAVDDDRLAAGSDPRE